MNELSLKNNTYILYGKKFEQFIKRFVTKSRKKDINSVLFEDIKKFISVEKSKEEEAKKIVTHKANINLPPKTSKKANTPPKENKDPFQQSKIKVGSLVKLIETKQTGTVEEIQNELCTVTFGFLKMKVNKEKLMWVK